jgi:hypothetical protein
MESEVIVRETSASSKSYSTGLQEQDISSEEFFPLFMIDPAQAWYWTAEWQEKEREVDEHLAAGRYRDFDDIEDLIRYLDSDDK